MMKRKLEIWTFFTFALLALFLVFLIYPLFGILQQSVIDENGRFTLEQFHKFFTNPYYSSTILNSFTVTIAITVSTLVLGIPFAYLHQAFGRAFYDKHKRNVYAFFVFYSIVTK